MYSPTASVIATHPKPHMFSPQHYHQRTVLIPSALKLTYHSRSECSSSDDNMTTSHDVASGLQMVHNKAIVHPSELIAEEDAIELSTMPVTGHRLVEYEDSLQTTSTFSPKTVSSSDRETLETTLSASTTIDTFDRESHSRSMRSRSYLSNSPMCGYKSLIRCCQNWMF